MDRRYLFLLLTLLSFFATSLSSLSAWRGVVAPILFMVFLCMTCYCFIVAKIGSVTRPEQYVPSPEEAEALKRAELSRGKKR
jgi:hypothetical protein